MAVVGTRVDARVESAATSPSEPSAQRADPNWWQRNWILLVLVGLTVTITLLSKHLIYPAFSWNRDEATYLWQVESLRHAQIFTSDGGAPRFFWPWLSGVGPGSFFSQYTVGWPLVLLAVDEVFGSPDLAICFGAVLAVLGTYAFTIELTRNRQLALVSASLMVVSPLIVIQGGVFLPYLFSLGLGLFFATALLRGIRTHSVWMLVAAGVILGWLLLTRPFDAVLWAAPIVIYALIVYWRRWRVLFEAAFWSGVGLMPFVIITFLYNHKVTGSFTEFPITAKEPLDSFGFGLRRLMPIGDIFNYTIGSAFKSTLHNLRVAPPFIVGGWVGALLIIVGIWLRRRDRTSLALLGVAFSIPLGYFFFWGNLLSSRAAGLSAPIYFIPLFAPACVFIATVLIAAWRRRHALGVALAAVMVVAMIPPLVSKIDVNHRISAAQVPWKGVTDSIRQRALVFVENSGPYLMHLDPYSGNTPNVDGRIVFSVDRGAKDLDLIAAHPERTPYLERTTDPAWDDPVGYNDAPTPRISLIPLRVINGRSATFRVAMTNTRGAPMVVAYAGAAGHIEQRTLATDSRRGDKFTTDWSVAPSPDAGQLGLSKRTGIVRIGFGAGRDTQDALNHLVEQQFLYRADGATGTMQLLYPPRHFKQAKVKHHYFRREISRARGLDVELTMNL
jgi:hypothetical protein